jgi:hypothetical protein
MPYVPNVAHKDSGDASLVFLAAHNNAADHSSIFLYLLRYCRYPNDVAAVLIHQKQRLQNKDLREEDVG